jgi:tRNA pseudouridine38-40 synthase
VRSEGSRTLRLTLAYEGTAFSGWQRQPGERTVQAVVEGALESIEGRAVTVIAAGRTDAGVHARALVVSVEVRTLHGAAVFQRALNVRLPEDVRVTAVDEARPGFHARRDAKTKTYHYVIANGADPSPFIRRVVWHVPQALDIDAMSRAAGAIVGRHDFAAFQATGGDVRTSVRRVLRSDFGPDPAAGRSPVGNTTLLRYRITGTGFLRHMVRNIVGTLVDIGKGRWPAEEMAVILASGERARAGATAPPEGLTLVRVTYDP